MSWKTTWGTVVGKISISAPHDKIDNIDKTTDLNSVNFVNIVQGNKNPKLGSNPDQPDHLADYLLENMEAGGFYLKHWLSIRKYCRRELPANGFRKLDSLHRAISQERSTPTENTCLQPQSRIHSNQTDDTDIADVIPKKEETTFDDVEVF